MPIRVDQSSQAISWFKDRLQEERLEFKPPFQRNPVWSDKHKAYLVDTVLRGLPVPEVYIQKDTNEDGVTAYAIVDGQQRIRSLLEFPRGQVALMGEYSTGRDGATWEDLSGDERRAFWHYRLVVREIEGATEADLRDLFQRLNQNTVTLNAQEIRNARFKGDFITTCATLADEEFWAENRIVSTREIRRMLDIEYIAELMVGLMHGPQNKKSTLDGAFRSYEDGIPEKATWLSRFERTRALTELLVPNLSKTRWRGRSDYYSLFLVLDELSQHGYIPKSRVKKASATLTAFGEAVTRRLSKGGSRTKVTNAVRRYSAAVEKAASDKDRRETRHQILISLLKPFFTK